LQKFNNEDYESFKAKARSVIIRYTNSQELIDEFPSYAIISKLECGSRSWGYILSDFLRKYLGRTYVQSDGTRVRQPKHTAILLCIDQIRDIEGYDLHLDDVVFLNEFRKAAINSIGNRRMKEVVKLYFWGDLSCREIGEIKGLSEQRVVQLLNKAILKLQNTKRLETFNR